MFEARRLSMEKHQAIDEQSAEANSHAKYLYPIHGIF
jgi:hypothetical protein